MNYERSFVLRILLCLTLAGALCSSASAAAVTAYWTDAATPGLWSTPGNWSTGYVPVAAAYPIPGDTAIINNGNEAVVAVNTGYLYANQLRNIYVGYSDSGTDSASGSGTLTMSVGDGTQRLYASDGMIVGNETATATGSVTGTLNVYGGNRITILNPAGNLSDNLTVGMTGGGFSSTGIVNQTGGNVNVGERLYLGMNGASTGTYTISGGVLNVHNNAVSPGGDPGGSIILGNTGTATGEMDISGTAQVVIQNLGAFWVNNVSAGTSTVNQTGGIVRFEGGNQNGPVDTASGNDKVFVGANAGAGIYNLSGGTLTAADNGVFLAWSGSTTVGTFHLDTGGTLVTRSVMSGSTWGTGGTGNFYFNGGTLQPAANNDNFVAKARDSSTFNAYVSTGGAKINTAGYNVGINVDLKHDPALVAVDEFGNTYYTPDGGLTKDGNGTLSLNTGLSNFNGPINVNAGTLMINVYVGPTVDGGGGGACTVSTGAALGGSGQLASAAASALTVPLVTVNSGSAISPGTNTVPGTLTITGYDLLMKGNTTLNVRLGSANANPYDSVTVAANTNGFGGNISLGNLPDPVGNLAVNINPYQSSIGSGIYTLMTYGTLEARITTANLSYVLGGAYTGLDVNTLRQTFAFDLTTANQVNFIVAGTRGNLTWTGAADSNWNVANNLIPGQGSINWTNANVPIGASRFYNADDVTFAPAGGPYNVTLTDNVLPASVTMNLSTGILYLNGKTLTAASWNATDSTIDTTTGGSGNLAVGALSLTTSTLIAGAGSLNITDLTLVSGAINGAGTVTVSDWAELQSGTVVNLSSPGFTKITDGTVTLTGAISAGYVYATGGNLIFDSTSVHTGNGIYLAPDNAETAYMQVISGASISLLSDGLYAGCNTTSSIGVINTAGNLTIGGLGVGNNGSGYMYQTGGIVNSTGGIFVGQNASGTWSSFGSYKITGGAITVSGGNPLCVANCGSGILDIQNATISMNDDGAIITGTWATYGNGTTTGVIIQRSSTQITLGTTGGTTGDSLFWADTVMLGGNGGTGVYNQLGGTLSVPGNGIAFSWFGSSTLPTVGIYNLGKTTGGTQNAELITSSIHSGSTSNTNPIYTSSYFNFHGGTLTASRDNSNFIYNVVATGTPNPNGITAATVYKEGAIINTGVYNVTIATALVKPDGKGVSSISVATGGTGFQGAPIVQITDATGVGATAIADMTYNAGTGLYDITGFTITNPGTGYSDTPTATILGTSGDGVATTFNAASALNDTSGGLTKKGLGILTLTGALTYGGDTVVETGTLDLTVLNNSANTLVETNATLSAESLTQNTLTIQSGGTVIIKAISGGGTSGSALSPVPEPSTITLLALAGLGLLIGALRKRRS